MTRRVPVLLCFLVAALALPAPAGAALPRAPVITSVSPARLAVGDTLTIRGRNFIPGTLKNTVIFQRARARAVFVRADSATATRITVRVPAKLIPFLSQRAGSPIATRFRLRVLARRLGLAFTPTARSPMIGPTGTGRVPAPPPIAGIADCDRDGVPNSAEADDDNDLLLDTEETAAKYKTSPCNPDSDGDTVEDGYEVHSALDMNSRALPYPGKRPYPNALDGGDAGTDYDGDGMLQIEEFAAWIRYFPHVLAPNGRLAAYSDGDQTTGGPLTSPVPGAYPVPPGGEYLNTDESCSLCIGSLFLTDDEIDVDGDGIGNWDEIRGAFDAQNAKHIAYKPLLDYLDPDTDGDTVLDGPDDQDHDDVSNVSELQDPTPASGGYAVDHRFDHISSNALDPCFPDINSRSCPLHPE